MAPHPSRSRRRWALLALVGVLLFAAGLAAGVLSGGRGAAERQEAAPASSSSPSPEPSTSGEPVSAADAAAACARAGEGAQEALDAIDEAGDAVADLDAQRLDVLIDGLRPLRLQLPGDVAACRAGSAPTS